jgi:hypothetical protein
MESSPFLVLYCRSVSQNWLRFVTVSRKGTTFGRTRRRWQTPRNSHRPRLVGKYIYFSPAWTKLNICRLVYDGRLQSTYEGNVIEPVIISLRI